MSSTLSSAPADQLLIAIAQLNPVAGDIAGNVRRVREARALAAETTGEIRLGVFWTLAPFYAADLMRGFARQAPGVVIRQQEMALIPLAEALRSGEIDLALTYDRGADLSDLPRLELAALQPSVVVAADHRLARRRAVSWHELADEPYVMLDGPGSRAYFEELLAEGG
ncbi:MAG: hypothetical protein E2577_20965, partial [Starkeya sp.]|nr:hypothetical protein [Starkeya sp.]